MAERHVDEVTGVETTGHEWDGIRELNNPMPRWWLWTFYATIIWAIGYTVVYPSWPLLKGALPGVIGYSSRGELSKEVASAKAAQGGLAEKVTASSMDQILADPQLTQFATAAGAAAFKVNCVPCHGSGAAGGAGYPNLNDDDWLWGGSAQAIQQTIAHGIRSADDPETRLSEMPAFAEILKAEQIRQVAAFVINLTGKPRDPSMVEPGKQLFADNCASCHGENAKGNRDFGAPNLSDAIWLRVHGEAEIVKQIQAPRHGMMPAWQGRLGQTTVKELAVYVHSLGGGEK